MKFLLAFLLVPLLIIPAFAETQTLPTDKGTLDVKLTYDEIKVGDLNSLRIDFLNGKTKDMTRNGIPTIQNKLVIRLGIVGSIPNTIYRR